jgi:hypothetical protein
MKFITALFNKFGVYSYLGLFGVGLLSGIYTSNVWHKHKESSRLIAIQKAMVQQMEYDRKIIDGLHKSNADLSSEFVKLGRKKNEIKIVNTPCNLTDDAIGLWNESLGIKGNMSKNTTGTSKETGTTSGIGIPIEFAIDNKLANDKRCREIEAQLDAIIEWDRKTFGK